MFTKSLEITVVKLHNSTTASEFDFDDIARGQHVEGLLHVVTGERSSDEEDEHESVPSPALNTIRSSS